VTGVALSRSRSSGPALGRDGRIACVAGCIVAGAGSHAAVSLAALLDSLFEQVLWVGAAPPPGAPGRGVPAAEGPACALRDLAGAFEAADREGVLVVSAALRAATPALLLALFAWPQAEAVVPRTPRGAWPFCALYRRAAALPAVQRSLAAGRREPQALLAALETTYLEGPDLAAVAPELG
jgi:hypothetical protein